MIAKDEENVIEKALSSVKDLVDEIIIVDTGSIDKTKDIAKKFTKQVYDFRWDDDFSVARNFSLSKASGKWVLCLDADETISKKDHKRILSLIKTDKGDAYYLIQRTYTNNPLTPYIKSTKDDDYEESKGVVGYKENPIIRLFKNDNKISFTNPIHESVKPSLKKNNFVVLKSKIPIHHFLQERKSEDKSKLYMKLGEDKLKSSPKDSKAYHEHAKRLIKNHRYQEAIVALIKSLEINKKNDYVYSDLIHCYGKLADLKSAKDLFDCSMKINPHNIFSLINMAIIYENNDQDNKALELFNKAYSLDKNDIQVNFGLALLYYKFGNFRQSYIFLKDVIMIAPNHGPAFNLLAKINLRNRDITNAKKYFLQSIKYTYSDKDNFDSFFNLAQIYIVENDKKTALKYLKKARSSLPFGSADLISKINSQIIKLEDKSKNK